MLQKEGIFEKVHNITRAILQDLRGFIWIGTQDGLNRYDGYEFMVYRHDPQDPHSLSDNQITSTPVQKFVPPESP